ncbi:hypothetical protein [Egicoccus sp. AB-alg6-2]|uniref:hypothetical protein n=1 Tax=Egicoccus sp. AB-alg6-2 TaxID=3242692 RepID=UPI00359E9E69
MTWSALHTIAGRQHGVVSRVCARDAGLSPSTLASRACRESWSELAPGCWLLPGVAETLQARLQAALLAYPRSVVTGWSAAALHGLRRAAPTKLELLRPVGVAAVEGDRVTTRRYRQLPSGDVTVVDGLEVVTQVRLLRELAGLADETTLTNVAIDVRLRRRMALSEAAALLQRDRRFRGRAQLRRVVSLLADDGSDSGFEHRVVARLKEAGLEPDGQQGEVATRDGVRRLDIVWSALGVAVECLGFSFHSTVTQLRRDVARQNAIAATDQWVVLPLTWEMFHREWDDFVVLLSAVLASRARKRAS